MEHWLQTWLGPQEWQAVALSLQVAVVATLASLPLGLFVAYALARWRFWGHAALNIVVHLPLVLPPVVTGYLLLLSFGRQGAVWTAPSVWSSLSSGPVRRLPPLSWAFR